MLLCFVNKKFKLLKKVRFNVIKLITSNFRNQMISIFNNYRYLAIINNNNSNKLKPRSNFLVSKIIGSNTVYVYSVLTYTLY